MKKEKTIKLSQWAKDHNYSYGGALKLYHRGGIPGAYQNPRTKTIFVPIENIEDDGTPTKAALYARVSTRKQKDHLTSQLERLREYSLAKGYVVSKETTEIASGMNENREKLTSLLKDPSWNVLVVEYKDRLARFGTKWIEMVAETQGRRVEYVNVVEPGDDESLVEDITTILSSFIGRMYGKRGSKNKAEKIIKENFTTHFCEK